MNKQLRGIGIGYIKEAEELLYHAEEEFEQAFKERDEIRARQVCDKAYLAMLKAFNALFLKKGKKPAELPKGDRGRRYLIHALAGKSLEDTFHKLYATLHVQGFHEGIILFDGLESDLKDVRNLVRHIADGANR